MTSVRFCVGPVNPITGKRNVTIICDAKNNFARGWGKKGKEEKKKKNKILLTTRINLYAVAICIAPVLCSRIPRLGGLYRGHFY